MVPDHFLSKPRPSALKERIFSISLQKALKGGALHPAVAMPAVHGRPGPAERKSSILSWGICLADVCEQPVYPTVTFLAPASAAQLRLWHLFIYLFIFQPEASLYLHQDGTAQTPERECCSPHLPPSLHLSIPPELRQQPFILTIATYKFTLVTYC